ncbi:MAG: hypothetical protein JW699_07065 [Chitinispirillaceae bacterium]|nr:hypothetical protein [Chitinispirillaceae bacterium]
MRTTARLFCSAIVCAAGLLWLTCNKSPSGPGDGGIGPTSETYTYTCTGTEVTISIPALSYSWCNTNDILVTYTIPAFDMTVPYSISGNGDTLTAAMGNDTAVFIRSGSGSGLIGTWFPVDQEQTEFIQMVFTSASVTITTYECEYADDFIEGWNTGGAFADSATYAVTVEKISCSQVKLTGLTTGEAVTITWNADDDATYSSSNTNHVQAIVYENPTSCPNEVPAWYESEFLGMNYKNLAPAAKRASKPAGPRVKKNPLLR